MYYPIQCTLPFPGEEEKEKARMDYIKPALSYNMGSD